MNRVLDPQQAALSALREGRLEEAEHAYRALLANHPHPAFLNNLALVLVRQRRDAEAVPLLEQAIAARPGDVNARVALSNALLGCDRAAAALEACEAILAIDPRQRDALHNRAVALRALARNDEAARAMETLLREDPADADAEFNLALAQLMLERYDTAWAHYEARWRGLRPQPPLPQAAAPLWMPGESLAGRAVLVQSEQGLGDVLQFLRFIPAAVKTCRRVALQVPEPLVALARRSFPGVEVAPAGSFAQAAFDVRLGLLSLPLALGLTRVGGAEAYLQADPARVEAWRARLPATRMVAVAWRGNPWARHDARRSMPLEALEPWLRAMAQQGLHVIALQKDIDDRERRLLAAFPNVTVPGEALGDFDDTAACMMLAGHVACVDTSVIHLAGALGRPATVLLQFASDWRWGIDRPAGATYRSVRTLRQPRPGDWTSVVRALIPQTT